MTNLAADRYHLGDARNGEETRAEQKVRGFAHLHWRYVGRRRQGQQHDLTHDRIDRPHLRRHIRRQLIAHESQSLGDLLAIAVNVGPPVELNIDDRKADA